MESKLRTRKYDYTNSNNKTKSFVSTSIAIIDTSSRNMENELSHHVSFIKKQRFSDDDIEILANDIPDTSIDEVLVLGTQQNVDTEQPVIQKASTSSVGGHQTAILLLDFQNEFAKKGGKLHEAVAGVMDETGMLQKVPELVDVARKMGALVIHCSIIMPANQAFETINKKESTFETINEDEPTTLKSESKKKYFDLDGFFTEYTWNCDIVRELEPRKGDFILEHRSDFSAFAGTKLEHIIKRNKVKNLYIMGYQTDICILETAKAASDLAPEVSAYVVADCCATKSLDAHHAALDKSIVRYANVITCATAKCMISKSTKSQSLAHDDSNSNSDEWLLVEKIFSAAGADSDQATVEIDTLLSIIRIASNDSPLFSSMSSSLHILKIEEDESLVSREDLHKILFERQIRSTFLEKLPIFILAWFLPFFYAFSSRLPFIFLALEVMARGGTKIQVGIMVGVYQGCRALSQLLIVTVGGDDPFKRLEILMVLFGLSGWLFLALYPATGVWWLLAICGVGFSETIVNLQGSLMIETEQESPAGIVDKSVLANRLGQQSSAVPYGVVASFLAGGYVYESYDFSVTCWMGVICSVAQLFGAIIYLCLAEARKSTGKAMTGKQLDGSDIIRSTIYQFQAASIIAEHANDVRRGASNALRSEPAGFTTAAKKAKGDHILTHALTEMYKHYFDTNEGSFKVDPIVCMHRMLTQIKSSHDQSSQSKFPSVVAVQEMEVAKLLVFLMQSRGAATFLKSNEFVSYWAPHVYLSMHGSAQASSVEVVWPYMKAVVFTWSVMALCIGTFLSIAVLDYTERFETVNAGTAGLFLAIGQFAGGFSLYARLFLRSWLEKRRRNRSIATTKPTIGIGCGTISTAMLVRPLHVPLALVATGLFSIGFAISNLSLAIVFQVTFNVAAQLSHTLVIELMASSLPASKFKKYTGIGTWLFFLGLVVTGFGGPVLYGLNEVLPFMLVGILIIMWALVLLRLMYVHANNCEFSNNLNDEEYYVSNRNLAAAQRNNSNPIRRLFQAFLATTLFPWHVLEQKYYSENKEDIDEKSNASKKLKVDISLLEHDVRRLGAALNVEQTQRRALEDRIHAAYYRQGQKNN